MKKSLILFFLYYANYGTFAQQKLQHISTVNNISNNSTFINADGLNNNSGAIIIVEYSDATAKANPHVVGLWYTGSQWAIFNQDRAAMPEGLTFDLTWKNVDANAYGHQVVNGNTTLYHPTLNNNPSAFFYVSQVWNRGLGGVYNNADITVSYNQQTGRWSIVNINNTTIPEGAAFNILVIAGANTGKGVVNKNTINIANTPAAENRFGNSGVINNVSKIQGTTSPNADGTYSDQRLNALLRANNDAGVLDYLKTLSLSQRIFIQQQSTELIRGDIASSTDENSTDRDSDGHPSMQIGGDDCDDLNPRVNTSAREVCSQDAVITRVGGRKMVWMPSLVDEDCNPCTYAEQGTYMLSTDGDKDGDDLGSCNCYNYSFDQSIRCSNENADSIQKKWSRTVIEMLDASINKKIYIIHGTDCDDANPSIVRNSQKCISENKVAVCIGGKWEVRDCSKCVSQPNGTGLVVEW